MAQTTDLNEKDKITDFKDTFKVTEENATRINVAELEAVAPDDTVNNIQGPDQ